jgi:hypothetical protein
VRITGLWDVTTYTEPLTNYKVSYSKDSNILDAKIMYLYKINRKLRIKLWKSKISTLSYSKVTLH